MLKKGGSAIKNNCLPQLKCENITEIVKNKNYCY